MLALTWAFSLKKAWTCLKNFWTCGKVSSSKNVVKQLCCVFVVVQLSQARCQYSKS